MIGRYIRYIEVILGCVYTYIYPHIYVYTYMSIQGLYRVFLDLSQEGRITSLFLLTLPAWEWGSTWTPKSMWVEGSGCRA